MSLEYCMKCDQRQAHLENVLNGLGYIPVISTGTGIVRAVCGAVQGFFGAVGCCFRGAQYLVTRNPDHRYLAADNYWDMVHGELNVNRGSIEAIPVAGNLATFVYDHVIGLRANYTFENLNGKDPLFAHYKTMPAKTLI